MHTNQDTNISLSISVELEYCRFERVGQTEIL